LEVKRPSHPKLPRIGFVSSRESCRGWVLLRKMRWGLAPAQPRPGLAPPAGRPPAEARLDPFSWGRVIGRRAWRLVSRRAAWLRFVAGWRAEGWGRRGRTTGWLGLPESRPAQRAGPRYYRGPGAWTISRARRAVGRWSEEEGGKTVDELGGREQCSSWE
jgi:hypothetical protein